METITVYWAHIGIMEKKMETPILYRGYIGIIEKEHGNYYFGLGV